MTHASRILNYRRRAAAVLLPTLPAVVASAALLHARGGLSAEGLSVVVLAAIAAGTWVALRLVSRIEVRAAHSEIGPVVRLFTGYRA